MVVLVTTFIDYISLNSHFVWNYGQFMLFSSGINKFLCSIKCLAKKKKFRIDIFPEKFKKQSFCVLKIHQIKEEAFLLKYLLEYFKLVYNTV